MLHLVSSPMAWRGATVPLTGLFSEEGIELGELRGGSKPSGQLCSHQAGGRMFGATRAARVARWPRDGA